MKREGERGRIGGRIGKRRGKGSEERGRTRGWSFWISDDVWIDR